NKTMKETFNIILLVMMIVLLHACSPPQGVDVPLPATPDNNAFTLERGSEKGILLLHGLTATPWEVRALATYLADHNVTVVAPLLPGHGTTAADLNTKRWEEWYAAANDSLRDLRPRVKKLYVGGVSTGADLAVLLAAEHELDGVILIATPIELQDGRAQFASVYKYLLPYAPSKNVGDEIGHYYDYFPSNAVAELVSLIGKVKTALPRVSEPALILQSIHDKTVKPQSANFVYAHLGSARKEWLLYGNATHVLVKEKDAPDIVFTSVDDFITQN
ncbi:MAG: alpha/beta fold hydrolase, partial [Nanoarchaeota archaeon]